MGDGVSSHRAPPAAHCFTLPLAASLLTLFTNPSNQPTAEHHVEIARHAMTTPTGASRRPLLPVLSLLALLAAALPRPAAAQDAPALSPAAPTAADLAAFARPMSPAAAAAAKRSRALSFDTPERDPVAIAAAAALPVFDLDADDPFPVQRVCQYIT
jgi:hypothetical protein